MKILWLRLWKLTFIFNKRFGRRILKLFVFPSVEHKKTINKLDYDVLIDVGANRGQFSMLSQILRPTVPVYAFEPLFSEITVYKEIFSECEGVTVFQYAIGDVDESRVINVSKSPDSSSVLPISQLQSRIFPGTEKIDSQKVEIRKLSSFMSCWTGFEKILLKIDVQGFEYQVLVGIGEYIGQFKYIYVETSGVELYLGQKLFPEIALYLENSGFVMVGCFNEITIDGAFGQADVLFVNRRF